MKARILLTSVVFLALHLSACGPAQEQLGREADGAKLEPEQELKNAITKTQSEEEFHIDGTVTSASAELKSAIGGVYSIDIQKPDRQRSTKRVGGRIESQNLIIGSDAYNSTDGGSSWRRSDVPIGASLSSIGFLLDKLDQPCAIEQNGKLLEVAAASEAYACKEPLHFTVGIRDGLIETIAFDYETEVGTVSTRSNFVYGQTTAPIDVPDNVTTN